MKLLSILSAVAVAATLVVAVDKRIIADLPLHEAYILVRHT